MGKVNFPRVAVTDCRYRTETDEGIIRECRGERQGEDVIISLYAEGRNKPIAQFPEEGLWWRYNDTLGIIVPKGDDIYIEGLWP